MTRSCFSMLLCVALACSQVQSSAAQTPPVADSKPEPAPASAAELRDKQLDISLEAREIEGVLGKLKKASELARSRMDEAAQAAEASSAALDRQDRKSASEEAAKARAMFLEIIQQLEALLAEETPQRIAAARNLAKQLAMMERQFAQRFPGVANPTQSGGKAKLDPNSQLPLPGMHGSTGPRPDQPQAARQAIQPNAGQGDKPSKEAANGGAGTKPPKESRPGEGDGKGDPKVDESKPEGQGGSGGKPTDRQGTGGGGKPKDLNRRNGSGGGVTDEERNEALAARAAQLAETGQTLGDILQAISQSAEPADKDAAGKVAAILQETDLQQAIAAMQQAIEQIRTNRLDDARISALDLADRLEIAATRLDAAYRVLVAPQAEELRNLERQLTELQERLERLETPSQIAAWHREASELLDQLERLGISEQLRNEFIEQMKLAGLGIDGARSEFKWALVNNRYVVPNGYAAPLLRLQEEVQARMQTLLLGDLVSATDEATPPKYQEFVERYYKVLSGASGQRPKSAQIKSEQSPTDSTMR